MERNVVLADEVDGPGLVALPPIAPGLRVALDLRPLLGGRQVADDGLEPDVDPLARPQVVHRHVDSPVQIAGDGPVVETVLHPTLREVQDVTPPPLATVQPGTQRFGEVGKAEIEVLGLAHLRCAAGDLGSGINKFLGVQRAPAVLALVAPGLRVVAVGAGALDVAVGQEATGLGVVVLVAGSTVDVAVLQQA